MLDEENVDQQEALGVIGVNLLYGAFYYHRAGKSDFVASGKSRTRAAASGHDQIFRTSI